MESLVLRVNLTRKELRKIRIKAAETDTPVPQLIARAVRENLKLREELEVAERGDDPNR